MNSSIEYEYSGRPSSLRTLWKGFKTRKGNTKKGEKPRFPKLRVKINQYKIREKHLGKYCKICGIENTTLVPQLYPLMMIYPLNLRMISLKEFPLGIFSMLNTRTAIKSHRQIDKDFEYCLECELLPPKIVKKGVEAYIKSILRDPQGKAWECTKTFYFRGSYGESDFNYEKKIELNKTNEVKSWILSGKNGFKFAKISGDSNGIHYSSKYAKIMGFKRDFAQPMMVLSRCLDEIKESHFSTPSSLEFHYKGQAYYGTRLSLFSEKEGEFLNFALYCQGNEKPCILGEIKNI